MDSRAPCLSPTSTPPSAAGSKSAWGSPPTPQVEGWPCIRSGRHTLIASPTGTGKTLAAFLWAIDTLLRQGRSLPDETQVLYVRPLRAPGNDVQRNLMGPLAELAGRDPDFPALRVLVQSGDTPAGARVAMRRRPPHILVTTPESLFTLLGSEGGRRMLRIVRTVILEEIHAVAGDKRGAHLALLVERLEALVADAAPGQVLQRIGLSATRKPLAAVAHLLVGAERICAHVDIGHRRDLDLGIELPDSPLATVCSHAPRASPSSPGAAYRSPSRRSPGSCAIAGNPLRDVHAAPRQGRHASRPSAE